MVVFTFSVLDRKHPFFGKFGPLNQNFHFQLKFSTKPISNVQNPMAVFTFLVLNGNHHFMGSLVQKIKIVSLS